MTPEDAPAAAALHQLELTGPMTRLGPAFTAAFHRAALGGGQVRGWCVEREGRLVGFLVGALEAHSVFERTFRSAPLGLLLHLCLRLLRDASAWPLARSFLRRSGPELRGPEITFIAVDPGSQRLGIASALLARWEQFLRERGAPRYEVSVDASNRKAIAFYGRHKFEESFRFEQYGRKRLRLAKAIGSSAEEAQ